MPKAAHAVLAALLIAAGPALAQPTARDQLDWLLTQFIRKPAEAAPAIHEQFDEAFKKAATPTVLAMQLVQLKPTIGDGPMVVESVEPGATDQRIVALVRSHDTNAPLKLTLVTDAEGKIAGFGMAPVAVGGKLDVKTWTDLDAALAALPGTTSLAAMRLVDGELTPLHFVNPNQQLAVGSAFKLYVLGALDEHINETDATWSTQLAIEEDKKSLPSGLMQNEPAGATFPLSHYAGQMIAISDNTATDHLIHYVGRDKVEAFLADLQEDPALTLPFMTTHEMFTIKLCGDADLADRYAKADTDARRTMLDTEVTEHEPKMFLAGAWTHPIHIDAIEWFASTRELCAVMADLHARSNGARRALRLNPGLGVLESQWTDIAFKGGSEPGVLNFTWLMQRADGETFTLALTWNNTEGPVDTAHFLDHAAEAFQLLHDHNPAH